MILTIPTIFFWLFYVLRGLLLKWERIMIQEQGNQIFRIFCLSDWIYLDDLSLDTICILKVISKIATNLSSFYQLQMVNTKNNGVSEFYILRRWIFSNFKSIFNHTEHLAESLVNYCRKENLDINKTWWNLLRFKSQASLISIIGDEKRY